MVIIALIAGFGYLILSMLRPHWALGLLLALLPSYAIRFEILGIPTTALEAMVGVFLLGVLVSHWNLNTWRRISGLSKFNWAVAAFVASGIIAVMVSPEKARALGQLKAFIIEPVLIFYATLAILKSEKDYKTPLKFLFAAAVIISAVGLIQYYTHVWLPLRFWGYGEEIKRITSVFEYPNALALYLAPLLLFFTTLHTKNWLFKPTGWPLAGLTIMAAASIMTYSRGGWIAIIAGLVALALQQSKLSLRKWGIIGTIILLAISPLIATRLKQTFHDKSSSERLSLIDAAVDKLTTSPIMGNGLYGFRATLENSSYAGEVLNYPHNIVLNFWLEMGLFGLVSFLCLLFLAVRAHWSHPSHLSLAAGIFLLVTVVHGLVDVPYFKNDLSILFWFILSAAVINTLPATHHKST